MCIASSPTASQPSSTPEDDLGTVAIVSLTFGVFAGVFITSVCTSIILICLYCTLRVKRQVLYNVLVDLLCLYFQGT